MGIVQFAAALAAAQFAAASDWNSNGFSDIWETAYGIKSPTDGQDADADGQSDAEEARYGTNPYDENSNFSLEVAGRLTEARLLQWNGESGRHYRVQGFGASGLWQDLSPTLTGSGTPMSYAVPSANRNSTLFRLVLADAVNLPSQARTLLSARDSDTDGQSDWLEWLARTSFIDNKDRFTITMTDPTPCVTLRWPTLPGIDYFLETFEGGKWATMSGPHVGTGTIFETAVASPSPSAIFRLRSETWDSDGDGLLDWEEHLAGLDPLDSQSGEPHQDDREYVRQFLNVGGTVELTATRSVLVVGETTEAVIVLRRVNGLVPLRIPLIIEGGAIDSGACEVSSSEINLKLGERESEIRFKLHPQSEISGHPAITVRIPPSAAYQIGSFDERTITIINPNLVNIADHGATGDGITDDTNAIQNAIAAMEQSLDKNGLYFPAGTYRIATIRYDSESPLGNKRMLKLGGTRNLDGRDILLKGEPGSRLYADPGSTRANMLLALASFRSLSIEQLCFEKSPQPLVATPGREPNGASGLAVVAQGKQAVEGIYIRNSSFINCHSSVTVYGNGYDIRGFGGCFHMADCKILNPYGANTIDSATAFGGGQQVALPAWVADAIYENCEFDGGGPDLTDPATSPGGRLKDGSHFGCPLRLIFRNNVVRRMGVEAVFQTSGQTFMGHTEGTFVMPPPDDASVSSVLVSGTPSTYVPGESVNLRTPNYPGSSPSNNRLTIRGFNANTAMLSLSNPGSPDNAPQGTSIPLGRPIYKDHRYDPTFALFHGNFVDGTIPPGGVAFSTQAGIVSETKCVIRHNFIKGHGSGILNYATASTPAFPPGRGMLIHDNVIVTRDARSEPSVYTYGIQTFQQDHQISNNLIVATAPWRTVGIAAHGGNTLALNNTVIADEVADNGYFSPFRSVGIGYGNLGFNFRAQGNKTRGFDVGLGSISPNAGIYIPFRARDHRSIHDVLPVDPLGLEPW
jgi:hypothetical protein